jgi:hypothetical protein
MAGDRSTKRLATYERGTVAAYTLPSRPRPYGRAGLGERGPVYPIVFQRRLM